MKVNSKLIGVAIVLFVCLLFTYKGKYGLIDTISNQVVEKIQKKYSPSPYAPGFNPDQVDVIKMSQEKTTSSDWR